MMLLTGQPVWQNGMPQSMQRAPCFAASSSAQRAARTRGSAGRARRPASPPRSTRSISRNPVTLAHCIAASSIGRICPFGAAVARPRRLRCFALSCISASARRYSCGNTLTNFGSVASQSSSSASARVAAGVAQVALDEARAAARRRAARGAAALAGGHERLVRAPARLRRRAPASSSTIAMLQRCANVPSAS